MSDSASENTVPEIQLDDALGNGEENAEQLRETDPVITTRDLSVYYGDNVGLDSVSVQIAGERVAAVIGPSGCGKSTFLRCINRMNDLIDGARVEGDSGIFV